MVRLLLADSDVELCRSLVASLKREGISAFSVNDEKEMLNLLQLQHFDVLMLDFMKSDNRGLELLNTLRGITQIPVIVHTGIQDENYSIRSFDLGADDYLIKPSDPRIIAARIRAILRRLNDRVDPLGDHCKIGDIEIFRRSRLVKRQGKVLSLTSTEYMLLEHLVRAAGEVISKDHLSRHVLGRELLRYDRSLDMHVSNLRKKLGNSNDGTLRIKTIRNVGYLYALPSAEIESAHSKSHAELMTD